MNGALLYLATQTWKNRFRRSVARLRNPRYLLGAIFGGIYFIAVFSPRFIGHAAGYNAPATANVSSAIATFRSSSAALFLFGMTALAWIVPDDRGGLVFTEAEVAFLFPAPLSRRTLVQFRLLMAQWRILFVSIIFTLAFGWSNARGPWWSRALGWWIILSTLNLHRVVAAFARAMLFEQGITTRLRRWLVLGLVFALAAGVGMWAWQALPPPPAENDLGSLAALQYYFDRVLESGPLPYLLLPFRWVVGPYLAQDGSQFLRLLPASMLILAAHYWWVIRADVAFEEASLDASQKMAERISAIRTGRSSPFTAPSRRKRSPFTLRPKGFVPVAFLWKNLISAGSGFSFRAWLILLYFTIIAGFAISSGGHHMAFGEIAGIVVLILFEFTFLLGPQFVRFDFRQDLAQADILKSYPVPSWQLALGELMAPVVVLSAVQWCLILLAAMLVTHFHKDIFPGEVRLAAALSLAVLTPAINGVIFLIPNAAVVLFPSWFQPGRESSQGFEAIGQRLIFAFGQGLAVLLALLPAAGIGLLMAWLGHLLGMGVPVMICAGSGVALVFLLSEAALGIWLLGKAFERLDTGSEAAAA